MAMSNVRNSTTQVVDRVGEVNPSKLAWSLLVEVVWMYEVPSQWNLEEVFSIEMVPQDQWAIISPGGATIQSSFDLFRVYCNANFPAFLEDGVTKGYELSVKEAIAFPPNTKIILFFNKKLQPIGQVAGLLSSFIGSLGANYSQFFIYEESWKIVNKVNKEHAYNMVKRVFYYECDYKGKIKRKYEEDPLVEESCRPSLIKNGSYIYADARVVGVSVGPCPTQIFGNAAAQPSDSGVQIEECQRTIAELKVEAAEEKAKRQTMEKLLRSLIRQLRDNLPLDVAAELDSLGSTPISSRAMPSSSGNHDLQQN
ncbi:hypothetical protein Ahy_B03g063551 [Arachis hypogaea]|uniref:Uncharacterized protein n=1 Tax=Arachis hypogaea TaxID=3818 RepID=A0A444ZXH6_ARAHY|nr:hypothetical protein Ahy_B03g063551 [Arachis hypogaea]